jgi:hypothetical protein
MNINQHPCQIIGNPERIPGELPGSPGRTVPVGKVCVPLPFTRRRDPQYRYAKHPAQYRLDAVEKIRTGDTRRFVLDEVQRIPELLNEVHALMEEHPDRQFILLATEVSGNDFSELRAFRNDNPSAPLTVVYRGTQAYRTDGIRVIPWKTLLDEARQECRTAKHAPKTFDSGQDMVHN